MHQVIKKIAFLGTPAISTSSLRFLVDSGYEIPLVVTGADKKRGRGSSLTPSPVASLAQELGLRISHDPQDLHSVDFDLAVVVAYGRLISQALLDEGLFVNLHFSLLPRWRGAAPMERAILAGDEETGVCVMKLVKELDAGPIFQVRRMPLDNEITLGALSQYLSTIANEALGTELDLGIDAFKAAIDQVGEPTYAHKLTADDVRIDWGGSAVEALRKVRIGRAWTTMANQRVKILEAAVSEEKLGLSVGEISGPYVGTGKGKGVIQLITVQPENRRIMDVKAWINGLNHLEMPFFL